MPPRKKAAAPDSQRVITVRVQEPWYEDLRRRAYEERVNISELVRRALREKYGYQDAPPPR